LLREPLLDAKPPPEMVSEGTKHGRTNEVLLFLLDDGDISWRVVEFASKQQEPNHAMRRGWRRASHRLS